MSTVIVAVDQGSSSTKVMAVNQKGRPHCRASRSLSLDRPRLHHVEQDPERVLAETRLALNEVLSSVHADGCEAAAIGLACQRSSFLLWNRKTGRPITPIISWQDIRAKDSCAKLESKRELIYRKTGLPLTGHYGGPKFLWLLRNDPAVSERLSDPDTVFSPLNSYLLWQLTEERICATDESVAGRTLFFDIHKRRWSQELIRLFQLPDSILPAILPVRHRYGHYRFEGRAIPILCSVGDHQSALMGLGGSRKGYCCLNFGTSGGALINIGATPRIVEGLLTNIAWSTESDVAYTAEGTVNAVGTLFEWFEKEKSLEGASLNWDRLAPETSSGWIMLPGMYGIAAPYWKETAPTKFSGPGTVPEPEVLLRAGIESIGFLVADILARIESVEELAIERVIASGGAARPPLLQFLADVLGKPVHHSSITDATALGCAVLAGLQAALWRDEDSIADFGTSEATFYPRISSTRRKSILDGWHELLEKTGIAPAPQARGGPPDG